MILFNLDQGALVFNPQRVASTTLFFFTVTVTRFTPLSVIETTDGSAIVTHSTTTLRCQPVSSLITFPARACGGDSLQPLKSSTSSKFPRDAAVSFDCSPNARVIAG